MASYCRVLLSLAASRPVVASSPFRISGKCSRKNRLKHGSARPRWCAIGPRVPMCAIGRREPPVLHGHWRSCPMAPNRMALPWLAASRRVDASSSWLVLRACDGAPLHLFVQMFAIRRLKPPVLHGHWHWSRLCSTATGEIRYASDFGNCEGDVHTIAKEFQDERVPNAIITLFLQE